MLVECVWSTYLCVCVGALMHVCVACVNTKTANLQLCRILRRLHYAIVTNKMETPLNMAIEPQTQTEEAMRVVNVI